MQTYFTHYFTCEDENGILADLACFHCCANSKVSRVVVPYLNNYHDYECVQVSYSVCVCV